MRTSDLARPSLATVLRGLLVALVVSATVLALPLPSWADHVTPARVEGATRFDTAARIATFTFDRAGVAHLVTAEDFPDALAGSYAAGRTGGPLLLVTRTSVPQATADALRQLGVERVVLIGGLRAIGTEVEESLRRGGYAVERVGGRSRYDTAAAVANRYGAAGQLGTLDGDPTALLASGGEFADALAAGPVSGAMGYPLLLTPSTQAHPIVTETLAGLGVRRIVVVGGESAVSPSVVQFYRDRGYTVERLAGSTRTATAVAVAAFTRDRLGWDMALQLLARGDRYPDALAGAVHGAARQSPILLTATPDLLSPETRSWLSRGCPAVDAVRALGGTGAVSIAALRDAVDSADACAHGPRGSQTYIVGPQERITIDPGERQRYQVVGRYDEQPLTGPVTIALLPCTAVGMDAQPITFADADGDRTADGLGTSDTGHARITAVNGEATSTGVARGVSPLHGSITFDLRSSAPDCAVVVVVDDTDGDGLLDVDASRNAVEPFGVGQTRWRAQRTADQTFGVAPQETVRHRPGQPHEFSVFARYDDQPFTGPVDIALFPCALVDSTGNRVHFTDADGDRTADGQGGSDTGGARILDVDGASTDTTVARQARPGGDGILTFEVGSTTVDCTVPVVLSDTDGDGRLDVDAEGHATEPFGIGRIRWE